MAKALVMFLHQEKSENCHSEYEPVISRHRTEDSLQWDEYDSCYSDSEPQLLDEDDACSTFERRKEKEYHCSICAMRGTLPTELSTRCSPLTHTRTPSRNQFCWLPIRRQDSMDDELSSLRAYRGIVSNPPLVCSEGVTRGNRRLLHRKAWLEVSDPKHRYGKHLRMYHKHWEEAYCLGGENGHHESTVAAGSNSFFDWLDSQGGYLGRPLPTIDDCPRGRLDSDTVAYINDVGESQRYAVRLEAGSNGCGRLVCAESGKLVRTGPSGWMFVLRDNVMYAAPKVNCASQSQRFHHSSFFGGRAVQAAGIFVTCCRTACLTQILPHSGHYRPGEADVQRILYFLLHQGICWTSFDVDVQQFIHVDRSDTKHHHQQQQHGSDAMVCSKKKKTDSLYLRSAVLVADYLSHKARCLDGIFPALQSRRIQ